MTFNPFETPEINHQKSFADVLVWLNTTEDLADDTRQAYRLAVNWAARSLRKPPSEIIADRNAVLDLTGGAFYDHECSN